ncbi:membrane fusion protein, multidrug efflux system [Sphingopyxis sp. YR583]|uniref:HlyD family secretion protein n=1 Tax=Sphingopyxis sp. YR583 TaxID=1881047 RepID=UPI0008A76A86|nr:HlyD family secretion protein [Sphingopyxis sp. YR583]SEH11609.1 membrane fusion protein, multidrug efflux system [Sphingopyxis sp. YR583]
MNVQAAIEADAPVGAVRGRGVALPKKAWKIGLIAAAAASLGTWWILSPRTAESTDNAYLQADASEVAPRVGGLVTAVLVKDNQAVRTGDPLVRIDVRDYDSRLMAAEAAVADADAKVATARATLASLGAEQQLAAAQIRSVRTQIAAADAEYARASEDRRRYNALLIDGFVTKRDAEQVSATAVGASSAAERSRADLGASVEAAAVTRAKGPILSAQIKAAEAEAAKARAALALAKLDRGHTLVTAPIDGVVGNRRIQVGDYVQPGSRLLSVVPVKSIYVVANFKETQTRGMRPGQKADVYVDALGETLHGTVESLAPGSASEFTLLPFEPGSGNFTKIVQRVGVRIRLDPGQKALPELRPGLSVTAKVRLRS